MKKSYLLILPGLVLILALIAPAAFCGDRNILTISNRAGTDINLTNVTCDGRTFGFPTGTLINNMGTSGTSKLLHPGSQIVINGSYKITNTAPNDRRSSTFECEVTLTVGSTCTSGTRTAEVTTMPLSDFDAWYITFEATTP